MIYLVRYNQYAHFIGISRIHGGVPSMYENDMVGIHYSAVCLHYIILDWW